MKLGLDGLGFQKRGSIMESPQPPNMGRRKEKKNRPWLTASGQEIPTSELKLISRSWDSSTWEEYLNWFESSRREPCISRRRYDILLESQTQTIFEQNEVSCPQEFADVCEILLKSLPYKEEQILRHFYLAGRTQSEISKIVGISQQWVSKLKARTISRLKERFQGDTVVAERIMRGSMHNGPARPSIWDDLSEINFETAACSSPLNPARELKGIGSERLKNAILDLSPRQSRAYFHHFWCRWPLSRVAKDLDAGINVTGQLLSSAVNKIKQKFLETEINALAEGEANAAQ